jgi:GNAT superfamily N-acetyltransferase
MEIQIKEVQTKKDYQDFVYLPEKIHKDHTNWIPPIYSDDIVFFNPKKNESFKTCDYKLLLAIKDGKVVGRCMGLVHHKYNAEHNEKCGRFSFLETYNDFEVFHALIDYVAQWSKSLGMEQLIGPLAFSDHDPQGFLIEGYDEVNVIASTCNFRYITDFCEKEGFTKKVDLIEHNIPIPEKYPPLYEKVAERYALRNKNLRVAEYKSRLQFRSIIKPVLTLINETFTNVYGFTPFTDKEMNEYANRYIFLLSPDFIKVVFNENNEVVGAIIGIPDYSKGFKKCNGRLFPFGFIPLLAAGRKTDMLILLLGAVDPRYQGRGLEVLMGTKMMDSAKKRGIYKIDSHLGLEYNDKRNAEMERMGGKVYKRYRIYQKDI